MFQHLAKNTERFIMFQMFVVFSMTKLKMAFFWSQVIQLMYSPDCQIKNTPCWTILHVWKYMFNTYTPYSKRCSCIAAAIVSIDVSANVLVSLCLCWQSVCYMLVVWSERVVQFCAYCWQNKHISRWRSSTTPPIWKKVHNFSMGYKLVVCVATVNREKNLWHYNGFLWLG